jgi:predicted nucleic acid-binding protein
MLMVDTTVWIDFFGGKETPEVTTLEDFIKEGSDICICGIILTEVLQGIRNDKEYRKILSRFDPLIFLPMNRSTYVKSAEIYRDLRRKGVTIRKSVDCMIAAAAIEQNIPLLHNDRDFDLIEKHCGLKVPGDILDS